jgi:tetratricopeptide (TPR) repeat protein
MSSGSDEELMRAARLDDRPGPARPLSEQAAAALVAGALAQAATPAAARRRPRWMRLAASGAVLALVSGAVAATLHVLHTRHASPTRAVGDDDEPQTTLAPAPLPATVASTAPAEMSATAPAPAAQVPAPVAPARAMPAADLLLQANRLRAEKRWRDAEKIYSRVVHAFPNGDEAVVAALAAASLRLEHLRDPRGALALYQSSINRRPGGPLAEEARFGIAQAWGALGDREAETRALEAFLRLHPDSVLHDRARARLSQLRAN